MAAEAGRQWRQRTEARNCTRVKDCALEMLNNWGARVGIAMALYGAAWYATGGLYHVGCFRVDHFLVPPWMGFQVVTLLSGSPGNKRPDDPYIQRVCGTDMPRLLPYYVPKADHGWLFERIIHIGTNVCLCVTVKCQATSTSEILLCVILFLCTFISICIPGFYCWHRCEMVTDRCSLWQQCLDIERFVDFAHLFISYFLFSPLLDHCGDSDIDDLVLMNVLGPAMSLVKKCRMPSWAQSSQTNEPLLEPGHDV